MLCGTKRHPDVRNRIDGVRRTANVTVTGGDLKANAIVRVRFIYFLLFSDNSSNTFEKPINGFVRIAITSPVNPVNITCALKDGKFQNDTGTNRGRISLFSRATQPPADIVSTRSECAGVVRHRKSVPRFEFFITLDSLSTRSHVHRPVHVVYGTR